MLVVWIQLLNTVQFIKGLIQKGQNSKCVSNWIIMTLLHVNSDFDKSSVLIIYVQFLVWERSLFPNEEGMFHMKSQCVYTASVPCLSHPVWNSVLEMCHSLIWLLPNPHISGPGQHSACRCPCTWRYQAISSHNDDCTTLDVLFPSLFMDNL